MQAAQSGNHAPISAQPFHSTVRERDYFPDNLPSGKSPAGVEAAAEEGRCLGKVEIDDVAPLAAKLLAVFRDRAG